MTVHPLDNPAWSALVTYSQIFASGNQHVKYFDSEVSPFIAFSENSNENFQRLYDMLPGDSMRFFIAMEPIEIPKPWKVMHYIPGWQMIYEGTAELPTVEMPLTPLTIADVPQMLELTQLTKPGPFAERTIDFGHYYGVFNSDKLVAMTGQRLHFPGYAEISAVCTHPDHLGKGYAKQLLLHQLHRIKAAAEIPFLHVRHDNYRAIEVYERVGFKKRKQIYFYLIKKLN